MPIKKKKADDDDDDLDAIGGARPDDVSAMESKVTKALPPATLSHSALRSTDQELTDLVTSTFTKKYEQTPRLKQVESVVSLAKGNNTVLLAGTGYGKTRIAETFRMLFTKNSLAIVVVLNPLDALGDNQVAEKKKVGFVAINLTALTFTRRVAKDIEAGVYSVIYISPELFLTHPTWQKIYNSSWFRNRLVLKVIDEAHMIYSWGLVETGQAKHSTVFKKQQDSGSFRPSWGKLGLHLMATRRAPLLMMSATCPENHLNKILANLSLKRESIIILYGELCRPEITILRITIPSLANFSFLEDHFPKKSDVPDHEVLPTLVYSGSRNATMSSLKSIMSARGTPGDEYNPHSTLGRRYHSCSGDQTKLDRTVSFTNREFPIMCCTSALGLGQNWPHLKGVIQLGRAGAPEITQVIGRVGRDKSPGLAVVYVEEKRRGGLNVISDFDGLDTQNDEQMMDAFAVTPICLRVATVLANTIGFIPMDKSHPEVVREVARERDEGFRDCHCSNCDVTNSSILIRNRRLLTVSNFEEGLSNPCSLDPDGKHHLAESVRKKSRTVQDRGKSSRSKPITDPSLLDLMKDLEISFRDAFDSVYHGDSSQEPEDMFSNVHLQRIIEHRESIHNIDDLNEVIGGEILIGSTQSLFQTLTDWKEDGRGQAHYTQAREAKMIADENTQIVRERFAEREKEKNRKREADKLESEKKKKKKQHQAEEKAEKEAEKEADKKRKNEIKLANKAANEKKQKEKDEQLAQNKRFMNWLKDGVHRDELDKKESEFQKNSVLT